MPRYNSFNKNFFANKKIKIIAILVLLIIFFTVSYFIYADSDNKDAFNDEEVLNNSANEINNNLETNDNFNAKNNKKIIVHVDGEVNIPGIVELNEGDRISNAIEKAGGIKENANLKNINLAFFVEDGMKIYIPSNTNKKGENNMEFDNEFVIKNNFAEDKDDLLEELEYVTKESGGASLEAFSGTDNNSKNTKNKKININSANQEELMSLPGIGDATALKIIDYRNNNGKFNTIEDIKNVKGIGDSKFENIKDFIVCK